MNEEKLKRLQARYKELIEEVCAEGADVPIVFVSKENVIKFLSSVKEEEGFELNFLSDLTAYDHNPPVDQIIDYGLGVVVANGAEPRFIVVYQLLSMQHKERLRVKVRVNDGEEIPSVVGIWRAANWLEREVYDLYGIRFGDHPNLRRIMLDDRWVGHPFRKDYPIKRYQRFPDSAKVEEFDLE